MLTRSWRDVYKRQHPGIAGIVDVIEQKESQLIVMDYVEGHSLDQVLEEQGVCSEREVLDIGIQLCEVLEYLHTRKPPVIYRDLKPSNVMKKPDGKLVLIDFGAAREYRRYSDGDTVLLGTRGYAAPEQYESQGQTDARTYIYSLGAVSYTHLIQIRFLKFYLYYPHSVWYYHIYNQ